MVEKLYIQHFLSDGSLNEHEEDIVCLPLRTYNETHIAVTNIEGLAPMPGTINMDDNAGGDGSIFNSARAQNRNIVITMKPFEDDMYDFDGRLIPGSMEACRRKIYLIFPLKKKVRLHFETDTRKYYIDGYVETINADYFGDMEGAQVSILCPDPYFKVDWKDVVPPEIANGFRLDYQDKYYSIDLSMHNSDGRYYYLDHNIPMIITAIINHDIDGTKWGLSIGCGIDTNSMEFMYISYVNFKQNDQVIINTKNRTVTWLGERLDLDDDFTIRYRNLLPFTQFNRIATIDNFEYYIPGNNPYVNQIGKHRLLFNNWFVFDKDTETKFMYFATEYIENDENRYVKNVDSTWRNDKRYFELDDEEYIEVTSELAEDHSHFTENYTKYWIYIDQTVWTSNIFYIKTIVNNEEIYTLTLSQPDDWSTNYTDYYIKDQFATFIVQPILEYEGV